MKKYIYVLTFAMFALVGCKDNSGLYGLLNDYDARISELEQLCAQMNTNIVSLQQIVSSSQAGDYITNVSPITQSGATIGYTITFAKSGAITIYNGKDGVDGTNGTNGANGHSPVIGVKQDTDGVYYWTLDGAWLTDEDNNKVRVTGRDGANGTNGQDGQNGQNGTNGTNGTDGVTPQLKIENDYWYISYNNGSTWTQLGKATGEDGAKGDKGDTGEKGDKGDTGEKGEKGDKGDTGATGPAGQNGTNGTNGTNGQDGQDGDSMFQSVTQDENNVYFTLADGTVITIGKGTSGAAVQIIDGTIMAPVSVSKTKQVYFSVGVLQFNDTLGTHQCADGTTKPGTWKFASQFEVIGDAGDNYNIQEVSIDGWIDEFQWGTSGFTYMPTAKYSSSTNLNIGADIAYSLHDWAWYNSIENGHGSFYTWRTLTREEYQYIKTHSTHFSANINGVAGTILYPDNYVEPAYVSHNPSAVNYYNLATWEIMSKLGAIFIPAGKYWTSTLYQTYSSGGWAYYTTDGFDISDLGSQIYYFHVRPVRDVQ